ncbi:MAG: hypothetical protein XXXJIFNMEKO3_00611 [Candidatus Erwinia impunctatus]|nr:hypothetical protein XXXJIFNMEKO_00611 [Culicoides impunctatus]
MRNKRSTDLTNSVEDAIAGNNQAYYVLQLWLESVRIDEEAEASRIAAVMTLIECSTVGLKAALGGDNEQ